MLLRVLAITFAAALALGLVVIFVVLGGRDPQTNDPFDLNLAPDSSGPDVFERVTIEIRDDVRARFPGAPERILRIASAISDPGVPLGAYRDSLESLTPGEIGASYPSPHPGYPGYEHTLLREAVVAGNTGVAAILVDRGADVTYNDHEMPFQAVNRVPDSRGWDLQFPDLERAGKLLALWLDHVEDVDIDHPLYGNGTLLMKTPINNLEAVLLLLEAGADPWSPYPVRAPDGAVLYEIDPFMVSLITSSQLTSEVAFRVADAGHFDDPPPAGREAVLSALEGVARSFSALTRESRVEDLADLWAFQRSSELILERMGEAPSEPLRAVLRLRFDSDIGGFYLAPGEVRSPYEAAQRTTAEVPHGQERWEGVRDR